MALDDTFERRRRRRRRVRGPLTLLFLVALVTGAAWYGYDSVLNVPAAPKPRQVCATPKNAAKQHISSQGVTVNIYNASHVSGLAERTAALLRQRGFTVAGVGNDPYHSKVAKVEVRGRDTKAPEVLLVAEQLDGETRRADHRTNTSVDIILGTKYTGLVSKAPTAMDVNTPVGVCVTVTPTPVALP
ncbi:MAG TPA: LytR C-terminal domain-containing protein [Actinopolymorphaceae bacterium]|nr:LytR C-terminal domain-containing protein [Actinopolymorphaceae bacterium]